MSKDAFSRTLLGNQRTLPREREQDLEHRHSSAAPGGPRTMSVSADSDFATCSYPFSVAARKRIRASPSRRRAAATPPGQSIVAANSDCWPGATGGSVLDEVPMLLQWVLGQGRPCSCGAEGPGWRHMYDAPLAKLALRVGTATQCATAPMTAAHRAATFTGKAGVGVDERGILVGHCPSQQALLCTGQSEFNPCSSQLLAEKQGCRIAHKWAPTPMRVQSRVLVGRC